MSWFQLKLHPDDIKAIQELYGEKTKKTPAPKPVTQRYSKEFPLGAWKFNIQPFQEIRTDRLTDQPTDMRSHREVIPQIRESSLI